MKLFITKVGSFDPSCHMYGPIVFITTNKHRLCDADPLSNRPFNIFNIYAHYFRIWFYLFFFLSVFELFIFDHIRKLMISNRFICQEQTNFTVFFRFIFKNAKTVRIFGELRQPFKEMHNIECEMCSIIIIIAVLYLENLT